MFDDSNRISSFLLVIDFQSIFMAILWVSLLILLFHFIRKRTRLIQNFGIVTLVMMMLFMLIRTFAPFNFSFTQNISSTLYGNISYFFNEFELFRIPGTDFSVTPLILLLAVWVGGAIVSFVLFLWKTHRVLKNFKSTMHMPLERDQKIFDEVQKEFGKRCNHIKMYRAIVPTPLTYGYFRPTVLIPSGKQFTDRELYCAFLHELTHYYHRDAWIKLLVQILCSLLWWNPLVYFFQKDVKQTTELHCDAAVCAKLTPLEQCDYLATIVNTMKYSKKIKKLVAQDANAVSNLASNDGNEQMQQRLKMLLEISKTPKHKKRYYILVCLLMLAVMLLSYLFIFIPNYTQYGELEEMVGTTITQENSYLVEYPENCYFLIQDLSDRNGENYLFIPLDNEDMVQEALEVYDLEIHSVDKDGFLEVLARTGSEDPEAEYEFWAYMYFPDYASNNEDFSADVLSG